MPHTSYSVGSAFAQALRQASLFDRHEDRAHYRLIDLINIGEHCSEIARALMLRDPAEAREQLIHGASRMLTAADMLDRTETATPSAQVIPFPGVGARSVLRVVS